MERLEELMKWQREQQEKLSQHQQEQKELLTQERKRLCEAFGLEEQDVISAAYNVEKTSVDQNIGEEKQNAGNKNSTLQRTVSQELSHSQVSDTAVFDEMPIIQPRKNFHELLQEKLTDDFMKNNIDNKEKPRRKFLRKGEGLARFYTKTQKKFDKKILDDKTIKPTLPNVTQKAKLISKLNIEQKSKKNPCPDGNLFDEKTQTTRQNNGHPVLAQWIHNYQSSPKPHGISDILKTDSPQDKDRSKREQEELQIFELLEQHAANSSFCSTSSLVARLMGDSTKSTPVKTDPSCKKNLETVLSLPQYALNALHSTNLYNAHRKNGAPLNFGSEEREAYHDSIRSLQSTSKPKEQEKMQSPPKPEFSNLEVNRWKTSQKNAHFCLENADSKLPRTSPTPNVQTCKPITDASVEHEFHDSQAWSDCSCSSCEESGSHNSTLQLEEDSAAAPLQAREVCVQTDTADTPDPHDNQSHAQSPHTDIKEGIVFKSSLLKERLLELENEIKIFKKENANFSKLRKQHEEEVAKFVVEKKQYENMLKEKTEKLQENIQEERRKLAKEKQIFEKYCKGIKNQPTRQEREEIQALKQQVSEMKEELISKDKRWSACQVRTRDRIRQLTKQIADLKEENEKLKAEKARIKKVRFSNTKTKYPNTKILHAVNEELGKLKLEDLDKPVIIKNVVPRKCIPSAVLSQSKHRRVIPVSGNSEWTPRELKYCKEVPDLHQKCRSENFTQCDTDYIVDDSTEDTDGKINGCNDGSYENNSMTFSKNKNLDSSEESVLEGPCKTNKDNKIEENMFDVFYPTTDGAPETKSSLQSSSKKDICPDDYLKNIYEEKVGRSGSKENEPPGKLPFEQIRHDEESDAASAKNVTTEKGYEEIICSDGTRKKNFDDGRCEIWYPNGNLRKVSADKLTTKVIYYNGDVKEKFHADGTERYYYAETKTWHTTYENGLEILEFTNGQVERRNRNGTNEICYPNGCKVVKHSDGKEDWTLTDGTVVKVDAAGCKEILLPNGQKEIHTKEHMRREYPDGTVRFVYKDGVQETRYADGRVRLKDKDGNLVMDSARR